MNRFTLPIDWHTRSAARWLNFSLQTVVQVEFVLTLRTPKSVAKVDAKNKKLIMVGICVSLLSIEIELQGL